MNDPSSNPHYTLPKSQSPFTNKSNITNAATGSQRKMQNSNTSESPFSSQKKSLTGSATKFLYSPSPNSKEKLSDRFIPCRTGTNLHARFLAEVDSNPLNGLVGLKKESTSDLSTDNNGSSSSSNNTGGQSSSTIENNTKYSTLLQTQFFGGMDDIAENTTNLSCTEGLSLNGTIGGTIQNANIFTPPTRKNLFRFKSEAKKVGCENSPYQMPLFSIDPDKYISPVIKANRKISKMPFKVLDAPQLQDDFYLNLVDWSSLNVLAVGLGNAVYIWSAYTSKVTKLCEAPPQETITSVSWSQRGTHLAVGISTGETQIWDTAHCKLIRNMLGHTARVGTSAWNGSLLSTGSRDRTILQRDVRAQDQFISKLIGHKQEVCGLKWSFDDQQLASGGNDNKLFIWSIQSSNALAKFSQHQAAVKAIGWSPHQNGLLATGGGTADRCIRFWNTHTLQNVNNVDTGSQVCNLMFSKNVNEIVSTHGYSLNQIIVWKYPTMSKVATLTGHTFRVLYLSMSPDGQNIVTGAGDETLRFWNVFPSIVEKGDGLSGGGSSLFPSSMDIR